MSHFPNTFVETVMPLSEDIGSRGNQALTRLNERGFVMVTGLTPYYAGQLALAGQQQHIREYCPKDMTPKRFATEDSTRTWLAKGDGRAPFLLLKDGMMYNYNWSGTEPCEALPDHAITTAYRMTQLGQRQGLFADCVQIVVSATNALYADGEGIGLETWQSNQKAIAAYEKVGFQLVNLGEPELRPTLNTKADGVITTDKGVFIEDRRHYMAYPAELLA